MDWPPTPPRPKRWENTILELRGESPYLLSSISSRLKDAFTDVLMRRDHFSLLSRFLRSQIDYDGHQDWQVDRLLGRGGWGKVGLWIRKDNEGRVVDEVAIKEELARRGRGYREGNHYRPMLAKEAVIQTQLNEHGSQNIVHLRAFKGHSSADESTKSAFTYRFYQEYAPYGDLARLRSLYRAKNQLLPEAFLWHVFDSLSNAARTMAKGPRRRFIGAKQIGSNKLWPPSYGIVHFDIKPANIMLSYEMPGDAVESGGITAGVVHYPIVKLGDFGISELTGEGEHTDPGPQRTNPNKFWKVGTPYYRPPEQIHYGIDFRDPPNSHRRRPALAPGHRKNHDIIAAHEVDTNLPFHFHNASNVWNIGKVMYDLATMSDYDGLSYCWATTEEEYISNGYHFMNDFRDIPVKQSLGPDFTCQYSMELTALIRDCLKPEIADRITYDQLWSKTQAAIHRLENEIAEAGRKNEARIAKKIDRLVRRLLGGPLEDNSGDQNDEDPLAKYRLFYEGSDRNPINSLPYGAREFTWRAVTQREQMDEYKRLVNVTYRDPSWPALDVGPKWAQIGRQVASYPAFVNFIRNEGFQYQGVTIQGGQIHFPNLDPSQTRAATPSLDDPDLMKTESDDSDYRPPSNSTDSADQDDSSDDSQQGGGGGGGVGGAQLPNLSDDGLGNKAVPIIDLTSDQDEEESQAYMLKARDSLSIQRGKKRKLSARASLDSMALPWQQVDTGIKIEDPVSQNSTGSEVKRQRRTSPGLQGAIEETGEGNESLISAGSEYIVISD